MSGVFKIDISKGNSLLRVLSIFVIRDRASTYNENQSVYRNKIIFRFKFQKFGV